MVSSIQKANVTLSNLSFLILTFEKNLCELVRDGNSEGIKNLLEQGFDPNYVLENDISLEQHIVSKGSSLIFLVIYYCSLNLEFWNYYAMLELLLEKNVNIKNSPGGGYESVLDYSCENFLLISEDILYLLLSSVDEKILLSFLQKVGNSDKKLSLERRLLFRNQNILNISEKELCGILIQGNESQLKKLLDSGLSPNYSFNEDVLLKNCSFTLGTSLIMATIKYCVENKVSENLFGILALLLEKGANLCSQTLKYVCKNEKFLCEHIVVCLLSSVLEEKANEALQEVKDLKRREEIKQKLSFSSLDIFFEKRDLFLDNAINFTGSQIESKVISSNIDLCDDPNDPLEGISSLVCDDPNDPLEGTSSLVCDDPNDPLEGTSSLVCDDPNDPLEGTLSSSSSNISFLFPLVTLSPLNKDCIIKNYCKDFSELVFSIAKGSFEKLEEILGDNDKFQKLNTEIKKLDLKQTLFSALFRELCDPTYRHKLCFLFLKYGLLPEDIVFNNFSFIEFLCFENKTLLQTLCLVCFFADRKSINKALVKSIGYKTKLRLQEYFLGKEELNIVDKITQCRDQPLVLAFIEASFLKNKNVITGEFWDINKLYNNRTLLSRLVDSLCCSYNESTSFKSVKRKERGLWIFELLLKLGANPIIRTTSHNHLFTNVNEMVANCCRDFNLKESMTNLLTLHNSASREFFKELKIQREKEIIEKKIESSLKLANQKELQENKYRDELFKKIIQSVKNESYSLLDLYLKEGKEDKILLCKQLMLNKMNMSVRHEVCCLLIKYNLVSSLKIYNRLNLVEYLLFFNCECLKITLVMLLLEMKDVQCIEKALNLSKNKSLVKDLRLAITNSNTNKIDIENLDFEDILVNTSKITLAMALIKMSNLKKFELDINALFGPYQKGILQKIKCLSNSKSFFETSLKIFYERFLIFLMDNGMHFSTKNLVELAFLDVDLTPELRNKILKRKLERVEEDFENKRKKYETIPFVQDHDYSCSNKKI